MTFLTLATRNASAASFRRLAAATTTTSTATTTTRPTIGVVAQQRWYSGPDVKVTHYEEGWTAGNVDDSIKGIEKYCTQTFNKISQVVS